MKNQLYIDYTEQQFTLLVEQFYKEYKNVFADFDNGSGSLAAMAIQCYREHVNILDLTEPETRKKFEEVIEDTYSDDSDFPLDLWHLVNEVDLLNRVADEDNEGDLGKELFKFSFLGNSPDTGSPEQNQTPDQN
jgi:hypothetical protein